MTTTYRLAGELAEWTLRAQVEHGWRGEYFAMDGRLRFCDTTARYATMLPLDARMTTRTEAETVATLQRWIDTAKAACGVAVTETPT